MARRIDRTMLLDILDGAHDGPEDVALAAKLTTAIFGDDAGPFVMVEVHALPEGDQPINEEAAADCARIVRGRDLAR